MPMGSNRVGGLAPFNDSDARGRGEETLKLSMSDVIVLKVLFKGFLSRLSNVLATGMPSQLGSLSFDFTMTENITKTGSCQ